MGTAVVPQEVQNPYLVEQEPSNSNVKLYLNVTFCTCKTKYCVLSILF